MLIYDDLNAPNDVDYTEIFQIVIDSDDGLSPFWCQPLMWTDAGLLQRHTFGKKFWWIIFIQNTTIFIGEN